MLQRKHFAEGRKPSAEGFCTKPVQRQKAAAVLLGLVYCDFGATGALSFIAEVRISRAT